MNEAMFRVERFHLCSQQEHVTAMPILYRQRQSLVNSDPVNLKCPQYCQGGVRFLNRDIGHFSEIATNRALGLECWLL